MPITPARYRVLKQARRAKRARPGTIVYACIHPDYRYVNLQKHRYHVPYGYFTFDPRVITRTSRCRSRTYGASVPKECQSEL